MSQHYAADPTGVEHDGRLYVYCSNDAENGDGTGYIMDSIVCFSTDDLKNWTDHGVVFDADELSSWYTGTAWAPCIVKNHGRFYLYFGDAGLGIGVVVSDSPTGPFTAPKNSLVVDRSIPGGDSNWLFDPGVFVDDDGTPYLYFGGEGADQARYIQLSTNMYDAIGSAGTISFPDFFEASHMHKYNGTYYYSYADNYSSDYTDPPPTPSSQIAYMTSSSPTGPFTYQGVALPQPPDNYGNNNHHTFFTYQGQWYAVYHNRYQAGLDGVSTTEHRNICLDELNYNPDGTILQIVPTQDGLAQLKNMDPYVRVEAETIAQQSGVKTEVCAEGGLNVTSISNGDWVRVRGIDFGAGATNFVARVASTLSNGSIELRLDSLDGAIAGTCAVPDSAGPQNWSSAVCDVSGASGVHDLYLKFNGGSGDALFNVDWWQFNLDDIPGPTTNAPPEPTHLYRFNESGGTTLIDEIGGANGTLPAGGILSGETLSLSGSGQYAELPDGIVSSMSECTIATWVKLDAVSDWVRVFDFGSGTGNYMFLTPDYYGDTLRFAITSGSGEQVVNGTSILAPGGWTHVAVTLDGATGTLYVNGSAVGSDPVSLTPADLGSTTQNWIGRSQYSNDGYLDGHFDEFRIYDSALSGPEIAQLYTSSLSNGLPPETTTIDTSTTYQEIEGIGGAVCFYNGWFPAHPNWQQIADEAFAGLNISMLRIGNWWRGTDGEDTATYQIVGEAQRQLGDSLPILMSSWSPPAYLKSNGEQANGGTLIQVDGQYAYDQFADFWYESLQDYAAHGIVPKWVSIQNEPDWTADYESCRFNPTEASWNGASYASYALALSAVYQNLQTNMESPPKLLGPGCIGLYGNAGAYRDYVSAMNPNHYYGTAHHLYGGSTDGTPDGYIPAFETIASIRPEKPRFMTEFGDITGMIECANLIHNSMVVEGVSGYNQWSLMWPGEIGLVEIENPWDRANWSNPNGYWLNPAYWSMKHFSYYIRPGYTRVQADSSNADILASAYLSPDGNRLVAVYINRNTDMPVSVSLDTGNFSYGLSSMYQSTGLNHFEELGEVPDSELMLPAASLTTLVLDRDVTVGPASNPSPATADDAVALNTTLTWTPGSNAVDFAVYLGTDSNAVATATTGSPEYQGSVSTNGFEASLQPETTYYWRVDGISYSSVGEGPVWSFQTESAVLPEPWMTQDVGSGQAGNAYFSGETFLIEGSGADIWNSTDGFRYVYMPLSGDCSLVARVTGVENTDPWAKGGIMIRKSLAANAANAFVCVTPGNGLSFQWRSSDGGTTSYSNAGGVSAPHWVKLERHGNAFTAYRSTDGTTWTQQGTAQTISMGSTVYIGLAVTAHNSSLLCSASFDNVSGFLTAPAAPAGLEATAISASRIDLSWTASADADSYNVKRSSTSGSPYDVIATNIAGTSYSDTAGLVAGIPYYYVVSASGIGGDGQDSMETSAVPSEPLSVEEFILYPVVIDGSALNLTISNSIPGHTYTLMGKELLTDPDWFETAPVMGTGTNILYSYPLDGFPYTFFFKVDVLRQ
ncbi:MAG: family 43 glycosylhydrolase [Pontiellaceae bacterium]|nr:family 43 glycosylhydrolase [Pontiellaceae bacterium]